MATVDCERARMLMHLRLDGELPDDDASALAEHVARCADCRAVDADLRQIDAALREGLAACEPPAELADRVRERLERARPARRPWATWLPAAAVFLIAAIGLLVMHPTLRPGPPPAPAMVVSGGDSIHVFEPNEKVAQAGHTGTPLREESVAWGLGGSTIALQFTDGARIDLSDEAVVRIGRDSMDLFKGGLRADLSDASEPFTVVTPWGEVRGQGAVFHLHSQIGEETAQLAVSIGEVTVEGQGWTRTVSEGQSVALKPDPERVFEL